MSIAKQEMERIRKALRNMLGSPSPSLIESIRNALNKCNESTDSKSLARSGGRLKSKK